MHGYNRELNMASFYDADVPKNRRKIKKVRKRFKKKDSFGRQLKTSINKKAICCAKTPNVKHR
jgi:hypothetical protein